MPSRIVREGILTSESVNACSWPAEVLYRRLMSVVDDFGRFYAKPALIRAACYPLQLEKVSDSDIGKWLLETEKAGLVRVYPASDGKRYLEIQKFQQRSRALVSRFPPPAERQATIVDCPSSDGQVTVNGQADAHVVVVEDVFVVEGERRRAKNALAAAPPGVEQSSWSAWIKHKGKKQTVEADRLQRKHIAEWLEQGHDVNAIVERAVASGYAGLFAPGDGGRKGVPDRKTETIDNLTGKHRGRTVNGSAERMGGATVLSLPGSVREPRDDDVEGRGPGGGEGAVG